jgi:hypothetical protein
MATLADVVAAAVVVVVLVTVVVVDVVFVVVAVPPPVVAAVSLPAAFVVKLAVCAKDVLPLRSVEVTRTWYTVEGVKLAKTTLWFLAKLTSPLDCSNSALDEPAP